MTSVEKAIVGHPGKSMVSWDPAANRANFGLIVKTVSWGFGVTVYLVWTAV